MATVTMPNCDSFYTQLGSIMEELANAAVAEICKLVDDGYAVLRLEMSRSHKENEALRKKLRLIEMKFSHEDTKKSAVVQDPLLYVSRGTQIGIELGKNKGLCGIEVEVRGLQSTASVGNHGGTAVTEKELDILPTALESADTEEAEHEILIKEEEPEEEEGIAGSHPEMKNNGECDMMFTADRLETQPRGMLEAGREDLSNCQANTQRVRVPTGCEAMIKEEPKVESLNKGPKHNGSEHSSISTNTSGSDYMIHDQMHQVRTFMSQMKTDFEIADFISSYIPAAETKKSSFHFEHQAVPATDNATVPDVLCVESLDVRPEVAMMDILPVKMPKTSSESRRKMVSEKMNTQNRPSNTNVKKVIMGGESIDVSLLENQCVQSHTTGRENTIQYPSDTNDYCHFNTFIPLKNKSHYRTGSREKRFFCKYCGVGFSFPNEVKVHQRRHTGEKPFSCVLCSKRFSQASYLKVHQRVHTGEKPFSCKHCGKRFGQSGYLNVHQRIHTGEKPFSCMQCGKSFTRSNHLKRHQSVHIGEKLITVTQ